MSVASANLARDRRLGQAMSTTKKSSTRNSSWQGLPFNDSLSIVSGLSRVSVVPSTSSSWSLKLQLRYRKTSDHAFHHVNAPKLTGTFWRSSLETS